MKAQALAEAGGAYLDLRRLEMAPALTREVATALASGQFVNFGSTGDGGHSAAASGSDDVMRVVQTLMAAQVITGGNGIGGNNGANGSTTNGARRNPNALPSIPEMDIDPMLTTRTVTPQQTTPPRSPQPPRRQ
jgi:hypothetical protein